MIVLKQRENKQLKKYSALEVACYIVNYCNEKNYNITHLRVEKILYFIQLYYLKKEKTTCFWEDIEAWSFGPVVPEVYHQFKQYCSFLIDPIKEYWDLSKGIWNVQRKKYVSCISQRDQENINSVIDMCEQYSTTELTTITKNQTPWINTYYRNKKVITISLLKDFCEYI